MNVKDRHRIRVMAVDDHPIFRQGLAAILNNDDALELIAEADTGEEAVALYREHRPDVTLMDLRLPGMNGVEAIIAIRQEYPDARIVVLTTEAGDALFQRALAAGAKGYVLKGMSMSELLTIISAVHRGKTSVPGLVATHIAEHMGEKALTHREVEVLSLIADGHRNKAVAEVLSISEETVKMHVKNTMAKLNANDWPHPVTIASQRGYINI